jgi:AraC-like DNA-binding protein
MTETLSLASPQQPVGRNARRRPSSQSRAAEFREKLAAWRRMPEFSRPPLRAVARELGTSHQLLSHYLKTWDRWQEKEYRRKANDICALADAENRAMTHQEQAQVVAYGRASLNCLLDSVLNDVVPRWLNELRQQARRGRLSRPQLRMAKLLARRGYGRDSRDSRDERLRNL